MGNWGLFFFSDEIAQLEAFKATLTDTAKIAEVDEAIAILKEKKGK